MDLWTWLSASAGAILAAILAYLKRGRILRTGSRIGAFLAAHKNLQTCRDELANQSTSFARQMATLTEHNRDLMTALQQSAQAMAIVDSSRRRGILIPSSSAPADSRPSSSPGQTRPRRQATRSRSHPVVRNGTRVRKGNGHEET